MSNPIKLGKLVNSYTQPLKCVYCGKQSEKFTEFSTMWLCYECIDAHKPKFERNDLVWFLKYNRDLDKLEVICGKILEYIPSRLKSYYIEYHNSGETFKGIGVAEDYIFHTKDECIAFGKSLGNLASENEVADYNLMKKQAKLYKQISDFLKLPEAIKFGVTGIDVRVENGYVNAEWKFGKRNAGDIKNDV